MPGRPPLPDAIAACRGISPTDREALIDGAKRDALKFTWAVKSRSAAAVAAVTEGYERDEWAALALVLAEGVQPGSMRLHAVASSTEEGTDAA